MLTVLMNFVFVLAIGIFIGMLIAFEISQNQLKQTINEYHIMEYLKKYNF